MIWSDYLLWEGAGLLAAGIGVGYWLFRRKERILRSEVESKEQDVLEGARREAENITREARLAANEEILKLRDQIEKAFSTRRQELEELERRLTERENLINDQLAGLVEQEKALRNREQHLESKQLESEAAQKELALIIKLRKEQLQNVAHLSELEARGALLKEVEDQSQHDAATLTRHILENAKSKADEQARRPISLAIQRTRTHTFSHRHRRVAGDDQGRIIGRRAQHPRLRSHRRDGVDRRHSQRRRALGFDPVRREIARAMQRLILDGRIHRRELRKSSGR
jgi:ribonuclease Y